MDAEFVEVRFYGMVNALIASEIIIFCISENKKKEKKETPVCLLVCLFRSWLVLLHRDSSQAGTSSAAFYQ